MASDRIVTAKDVLDALMRVQRTGPDPLLRELEQLEPDLCEYLLEQASAVHQAIAKLGTRPARTRRLTRDVASMALVLVFSLRNAHLRLWQPTTPGHPPHSLA